MEDLDICKNEHLQKIEKIFKRAGLINTEFFDKDTGFSPSEKLFIAYKLNHPINIEGFLNLSSCKPNLSGSIKRLIRLNEIIKEHDLDLLEPGIPAKLESIYAEAKKYRKEKSALNPVELLVLAEGTTEETLLPVFSGLAGIDFDKNGVKIISSGGKNQMLRLYARFSREINLPVLMIFDSDGHEEAESISPYLRSNDDIYVIQNGEFEDILSDGLICKAVNLHYRLTGKINLCDIEGADSKAQVLCRLWKEKGFGEFKKAEFARIIASSITKQSDLSDELKVIFARVQEKLG